MKKSLRNEVVQYMDSRVDAIGFAPVERFEAAPGEHHPAAICKNAHTVIVFGRAIPRGLLHSPEYNLHILHRTYHTVYDSLNDLALGLSNWLESRGNYLAVPIPSYAPMVFHGFETWGLLSLKHAAVNAGLGSFGKNQLVHHPEYGTLLRFAAVVTSARLPGDPVIEDDPCPAKCRACLKACPSQAIGENNSFQKMGCLSHTIKHAIYPLH